jgi:Flp pilus assembly protein protease CpaA
VALSAVDIAVSRLPDKLTLPAYPVLIVLLGVAAVAGHYGGALLRALLGGVALTCAYFLLAVLRPGQLGAGDVKLAGLTGLALGWLGWPVLILGAALAFVLSALVSLGLLAARRISLRDSICFGPFMLGGALVAILVSGLAGFLIAVFQYAAENRGHHRGDGFGVRLGAFPVHGQQVGGADERERERVDVSAGGDAAEIPLGGQVRGDHGGDFRRDRHAGRDGLAQPGAQVIPEDEEADDLYGDRPELVRERAGQVAGDGAGSCGCEQRGGLAADLVDPVEHKLGEEGVEVGEMPVQDALGAARFRGDRPAGEPARPVSEQHALGSGEQLLAHVADGDPCWHRPSLLRCARNYLSSGRLPT